MTNTNTSTKITRKTAEINSWDTAIAEAEKRIEEAKSQIVTLKRSVIRLRGFRDSGEPWPGTVEAGAGELKTAVHDSK